MEELLRTSDAVLITFVTALLKDAGIPVIVADAYISSVEGSIGAFPRRLFVKAEQATRAMSLLREADLANHLVAK